MIDKEQELRHISAAMAEVNETNCKYFTKRPPAVPSRRNIVNILKHIQSLMFPEYFVLDECEGKSLDERLRLIFDMLKPEISAAYSFSDTLSLVDTEQVALMILSRLPTIKESLIKDVQAIYEGDPAALSAEEVILSYPGFYAISIYRIAHEFYIRKIPYIYRIMTEFAHEKTGIDIHAGATIGDYFFIDHGTGVVIGETATIGNRVKIYQGVTLGAKSFELDEDGNPVKGIKRHPDIEDNCVIYANATILGGNTVIGKGSVIGAGVWLTKSVEPGTTVYHNRK